MDKKVAVLKNWKRYPWFLYYIPLFIWECFKANLDGTWRVIHPDLPMRPGIVKVKSRLKSDAGLTFLANTITLNPGTMTVDIDKEKGILYVHWVNVESQDIEKATKIIVEKFEKILLRIFE
jgi:multicomponent Na+:H+ antiporter subunit E